MRGYLPKTSKSLFICDSPTKEETTNQAFEAEGLRINVVPGSQYIGAYIGPEEDSDAWVRPQAEKYSEDVRDLSKFIKKNP